MVYMTISRIQKAHTAPTGGLKLTFAQQGHSCVSVKIFYILC